jgi:glycosyltransferase A (GT-A) superfamily protein (DUF2064 family)
MVRGPGGGPDSDPLAEMLGPDRWSALQRELISRAVTWAAEVAPGAVRVAYEPAEAEAEAGLRELLGAGPELFAQEGAGATDRLAGAAERAFAAGGGGPLLIVWPELPRWRPELGAAAVADLRDGCELSVGPVFDGGFYMLALARLLPALFELQGDTWRSADAMGTALAAAHSAGAEIGLLRTERGLRNPHDVRAALADPLLDLELRRLLQNSDGPERPVR